MFVVLPPPAASRAAGWPAGRLGGRAAGRLGGQAFGRPGGQAAGRASGAGAGMYFLGVCDLQEGVKVITFVRGDPSLSWRWIFFAYCMNEQPPLSYECTMVTFSVKLSV